ncbi:MAG TPA: nicotinate phosphoribosyltransferase [Sphaerochaeta sp.]|jgi:nicotinate phosphoribosyltransferase|nr:nicotinate phosphoribosyltransferase [Sphaerochaeta sp.]
MVVDVSALTTDFYELTMMQGYFLNNENPDVVFDMFYRKNPFDGGYAVFAGLGELLPQLESLNFSANDIAYLKSLNIFDQRFLDYLSTYKFKGDIYAPKEGTTVFPGEPLVRVHTKLIDAQLIESLLLNTVNFQTLIATKAMRVCTAAGDGAVMEFGLRRAQGMDGGLSASRAAYIGGCKLTSNTLAGKVFGIPVGGTMAHSWVMAYDNELEAFREFAKIYPNNCVLLIDTYDTLGSGIENAIIVGKEQQAKGLKMGVRIDSGDLSYLARAVRQRLDEAGLPDATICVSNDLTEQIITTLVTDNVPIDSWGVGTNLVTGGDQAALGGVYKLSAKGRKDGTFQPTIKVSNSSAKTTNPGIKQIYRFYGKDGLAIADLITLDEEEIKDGEDLIFYHPVTDGDLFLLRGGKYDKVEKLLGCVMKDGKICVEQRSLKEIQDYAKESQSHFHKSYKRLINPHIYKVSLSKKLKNLKHDLILESKGIPVNGK